MNIPKAIKLINAIAGDIDVGEEDEDLDALQLGIGALKRLQQIRRHLTADAAIPLPGETD